MWSSKAPFISLQDTLPSRTRTTDGRSRPPLPIPTSTLALVYMYEGHTDVEPLRLEMVDVRKKFHREMHPGMIAAYTELAATYRSQGRP